MSRLHAVRVTTTTVGGNLSYGAKVLLTTVVYAFDDLAAARACLECERVTARFASAWPGVTVEVDLESVPEGRITAVTQQEIPR